MPSSAALLTTLKCRAAFDGLFGNQDLFEPCDTFVEMYRQIHCREKRQRERLRGDNEREQGKPDIWVPRTQLDVIVLALQRAGSDAELELEEIYAKARMISIEFGLTYDWSTWRNSVRGRINTNTTGKAGSKMLFERVGGEDSRSGRYRLSVAGSKHSAKA